MCDATVRSRVAGLTLMVGLLGGSHALAQDLPGPTALRLDSMMLDLRADWGAAPATAWSMQMRPLVNAPLPGQDLAPLWPALGWRLDADGHLLRDEPEAATQVRDHPTLGRWPRLRLSTRWQQSPSLAWTAGVDRAKPWTQSFVGMEWTHAQQRLSARVYTALGGRPPSVGLVWRYRDVELRWRGDALAPGKASVWMFSASARF